MAIDGADMHHPHQRVYKIHDLNVMNLGGVSGEDFVCPRELVYTEIDLYLVVLDSLDITGIRLKVHNEILSLAPSAA